MPAHGRILVFEIEGSRPNSDLADASSNVGTRKLRLIAEEATGGGVFSLAAYKGKLAAGVNCFVELYSLARAAGVEDDSTTSEGLTSSESAGDSKAATPAGDASATMDDEGDSKPEDASAAKGSKGTSDLEHGSDQPATK